MSKIVSKASTLNAQKAPAYIKPYRVSLVNPPTTVYEKPGFNSKEICSLHGGNYTIVTEVTVNETVWGALSTGLGWIPLESCSRLD